MDIGGVQVPDYSIDYIVFGIMVLVALALSKSRLGWPLKWAETFYHEFSHGMACLLTFGRVKQIELSFNGAGCCTTLGGWRVPILISGYAGAAVWGGVIYMSGWLLGEDGATTYIKFELAVLAIAFLLWVRDVKTAAIMLMIGGVYALAIGMPHSAWLPFLLQFIGIYVMLNAVRAPLFLIDGAHVGDGADLADILLIPEGVWIAVWWVFSLGVMGLCMVLTLPGLARWLGV